MRPSTRSSTSCWNSDDPNCALGVRIADAVTRGVLFTPPLSDELVLHTAIWLAQQINAGGIDDPVHGATHYYNPTTVPIPPAWTRPPAIRGAHIGSHVFFSHVAF